MTLWEALKRYGRHEANCLGDVSGRPCSCGLRTAIDDNEPQRPSLTDAELYGEHQQPDHEPRY